jgi:hypothetical protein
MRKILIRHLFPLFISRSRYLRRLRRPPQLALLSGLIALPAALPLLACSRAPAEEVSAGPTPRSISTSTPASSSTPTSTATPAAAGLRWDDPSRWHRRPSSSPMRVAEYAVPRAAGDAIDGECTVITFGPGQGGSISDNVDRWVRQFDPLAGAPTKATRRVGGMSVTRVEVAGSYHPMMMPGAPAAPNTLPGARLVGAIVEAPNGLWFFKMTGPDATVRSAAPELDALVDSVRVP